MISYKVYKMINESLGGAVNLGMSQKPSLGLVSKSPRGFNNPILDDEAPEDEEMDAEDDLDGLEEKPSDELDPTMGDEAPMDDEADALPLEEPAEEESEDNFELAKLAGLDDSEDFTDEVEEEEPEVDEFGNPIFYDEEDEEEDVPMESCGSPCADKKEEEEEEEETYQSKSKLAEDSIIPPADPNVGLTPAPGSVGFAPDTRIGDDSNVVNPTSFYGYSAIPSFTEFYQRKKAAKEEQLED